MRRARIFTYFVVSMLVIALLPCACVQASPLSFTDAPIWLWFVKDDRSPEVVRERLNLMLDQFHWKNGFQQSLATHSLSTEENKFVLLNDSDQSQLVIGTLCSTISGTTDELGEVNSLALNIRPGGESSKRYLRESSQLMKAAACALFDDIERDEVRDLSLLMTYDVRPYSLSANTGFIAARTRSAQTIVRGLMLTLTASIQSDSTIDFEVRFDGLPTPEQMSEVKLNSSCNRKLHQSAQECTYLRECVAALNQALLPKNGKKPNMREVRAVSEQISESVSVIGELIQKMDKYEKTSGYSKLLRADLEEFKRDYNQLTSYLDGGEADEEPGALSGNLLASAQSMESLINLVK